MSKGSGGTRATNSRSAHSTATSQTATSQTATSQNNQSEINYRTLRRIDPAKLGWTGNDFAYDWNREIFKYRENEMLLGNARSNLEHFDKKHKYDRYLTASEKDIRNELVDRVGRYRAEFEKNKKFIDDHYRFYVDYLKKINR